MACSQYLAAGVECPWNTTIATLVLRPGYWRHSTAVPNALECKHADSSRTPCMGGADAGLDGDGYCRPGLRGPRCELCVDDNAYFDDADARCHSCGDVGARSALAAAFVLGMLAAAGGAVFVTRRKKLSHRRLHNVTQAVQSLYSLWWKAGMQCKVKIGLGLYQCIAAVPSVYNVRTPEDADELTSWMSILELPDNIGFTFILPGSCYGSYRSRLLVNSLWPFVLIGGIISTIVIRELVRHNAGSWPTCARMRTAVRRGLQRTLPLVLILSFVLVPSKATRIMKSFLCDSFDFAAPPFVGGADSMGNGFVTKRYLHDDLSLSCSSPEYDTVKRITIVLMLIWPVAIPLLYTALLWRNRRHLLEANPNKLSRASEASNI